MTVAVPARGAPSLARATLFVAVAACAFGSIPVLTTVALDAGAPLPTILGLRFALAALLFVPVAGGAAGLRLPAGRRWKLLLLAGGGQAAVTLVSLSALRWIPAATLSFLFYTYPAWIAVIAALAGTERLTRLRLGALALSLAGIAAIVGNPWAGALHPLGVALALGSAVIYALYVPLVGRLQTGVAPAAVAFHVSVGAGAICLAWGALTGGVTLAFAPPGWAAIALLAVVSTVVAFLLFLRGLAALGAVRTGIVSTVEPFWTAILAAVVLTQPVAGRTFVGGAMIAAAVLVLQRSARD